MQNYENINGLFDEIKDLQNRAKLLKIILSYYNSETMTFDVPSKWKTTRLSDSLKKQTPQSPRHKVNKAIQELLPYSEIEGLVNWNELYKTLDD